MALLLLNKSKLGHLEHSNEPVGWVRVYFHAGFSPEGVVVTAGIIAAGALVIMNECMNVWNVCSSSNLLVR